SHVGDFDCVVGIFNTRTSCGQVVDRVIQVGNRGLETVLDRTQVAAQVIDLLKRIVNGSQRACVGTSGGTSHINGIGVINSEASVRVIHGHSVVAIAVFAVSTCYLCIISDVTSGFV